MLQRRVDSRTHERILVMGIYGSGKSHGWATIRNWYATTETPGHFHIISTEYEMADRTAEAYPNFDQNATIHEATNWGSLVAISEKINEVATGEDWLVIDSIGNANLWVRDHYCREHFGSSFKEFMAAGGKAAEIGPTGWLEIDQTYRSWMNPNVVQFVGHKFACAQADTVNTQGSWADSQAIQKMYGRVGVKPIGHKELGYAFHTVLLASQRGQGDWRLTTIDDPSREPLMDVEVTDFVASYLMPIAGWTVG